MAIKLLYRDAQGKDAAVDLPLDGAFLGRAVDCVVRTDDAMVSRKNCKISLLGGRWYVEDLGSANGTFVNERRVQKEVLGHGDVIRCGSLQVRFVQVAEGGGGASLSSQGQQGQGQAKDSSRGNVPVAVPQENTGLVAADKVQALAEAPPPQSDRRTRADNPVMPDGAGQTQQVLRKKEEELKKATEERDLAQREAQEAKAQLEQAGARLDTVETDQKRLRSELSTAKDAFSKLRQQAKLAEEELKGQTDVNEQLRQEVRQLKEGLGLAKSACEDMRVQVEGKDRQVATATDEVRRARQAADSLSLRLQEVSKERDAHVRAINEQRGDADHLREILKERERMLEEKRVGLINLESQVKDLRQRAESLEKELLQTRGERDNARDRLNRSQVQVEELRSELDKLGATVANQQEAGPQLVQLSREKGELRAELQSAQADLRALNDQLEEAHKAVSEVEGLRATLKQLEEDHKAQRQKLREQAETAANQAIREATEKLKARYEEEREHLIGERDAALQTPLAGAADSAEHDALRTDHDALRTEHDALRTERDALLARIDAAEGRVREHEARLAEEGGRLRDTEARLRDAEARAQKNQQSAPPAGDDASARLISEMKTVATTAYDGINDAISELKVALVMAQETYERMERIIPDRPAAQRVREAIEQTLEKADEAKGHVRSLKSLID